MAKNFGRVNVSITASTGGLTAGLSRASKQLSGFQAQTQGIGGVLKSSLAGFVGLGSGASTAAIGIRVLGMAIKALLGPLLIITSLVAIFAKIGSSARELDEAGKTARRLGMSMTTFQNLSQVAEEAGVSVQQMSTLLTFMNRNIGNLANGSASAQKAFGQLGLTLADIQGLRPEQQFDLISQRIMALPSAAQRTAAAMAIFGRQGAVAMGFIQAGADGTRAEIEKLQRQLGITFSDEQLKRGLPLGIEMMNDALGRLSMVLQGFINQFVAELAPAVTTVSNLIVRFFAENTSGWSLATTLANVFSGALRQIAGTITFLYGAFQTLSSFVGVFVAGALAAFSGVTNAIGTMISAMRRVAENLPGMDLGVASSLRAAENSLNSLANSTAGEAEIWGTAAADNFADGVRNMSDPFAAFDAEFASVTAQMQQAGAVAGQAAGDTITKSIQASSAALKAIVVGSSEGEAFRNSILRGADPRNEGNKDGARTADASERTADAVEDLADNFEGMGLAEIGV